MLGDAELSDLIVDKLDIGTNTSNSKMAVDEKKQGMNSTTSNNDIESTSNHSTLLKGVHENNDNEASAVGIEEKLVSLFSAETLKKFPEAKLKLDELFFIWVTQHSTVKYLEELIADTVKGESSELSKPSSPERECSLSSSIESMFSPRSPRQQQLQVKVNNLKTSPIGCRSPPRSPRSPENRNRLSSSTSTLSFNGNLISSTKDVNTDSDSVSSTKLNPIAFDFDEDKVRTSKTVEIPTFYKPNEGGRYLYRRRRGNGGGIEYKLENRLADIQEQFEGFPQGISLNHFVPVCRNICEFPSFFSAALFKRILVLQRIWEKEEKRNLEDRQKENKFEEKTPNQNENKVDNGNKSNQDEIEFDIDETELEALTISFETFCTFWKREIEPYDEVERFFRLVKTIDREYIVGIDFAPLLVELLTYHPGLAFLADTPEFQDKYAKTVITRILYEVNTSWNGRITLRELRKSDLLKVCHMVDEEKDINVINRYFSYEHFYVLYCKFWELDSDHDFALSKDDLMRHGGHALTRVIVDRAFTVLSTINISENEVSKGKSKNMIGYEEFIFFFLSEEDKTNPTSLRFWFRCVDIDGDGVIRPWELRYFYDHQLIRMQSYSQEVVPFADIMCQMHDCLVPKTEGAIVLSDFLHPHRIKISGMLFNVLFNLNKFISFEQRDPFIIRQQHEQPGLSDWDRYAINEYTRLAQAEEQRELEESCELDSWESQKVNEYPY